MAPSQSLASSPDAASGSRALPETASDLLRQCRWGDALRALAATANPNLATTLQIRLARNMQALQTHRPEVYSTVTLTPTIGRYRLAQVAAGRLSIARKQPDGRDALLCQGGNPDAVTEAALKHLRPMLDRATPVAICGIGDGSLPAAVAQLPAPSKPIVPGLLPVVYLIEPDQEILLHCLMLRDFTGPDGPIENARFIWSVGPRWRDQLLGLLRSDPFLPKAIGLIDPGYGRPELINEADGVNNDLDRWEEHVARDVAAAYVDMTPDELIQVFSSSPLRPPRAMLLTSRFTTVLQHSIRDLAAAMESLGWETQILIEPSSHHQMPNLAVRQAVLDFRPDAVFTIDHLRRERPDVFPPSLPFVCWIQDDLPNLTIVASGRSITPRDFVLITGAKSYVDKFEYPARQCIYLGKLTRIAKPQAAERGVAGPLSGEAPDVTFVSNASAIPGDVAKKLHAEFGGQPVIQELIRRASEQVLNLYSSDGFFQTAGQARRIIIECEAQLGGRLSTDASRETLALWLVNHLNNLLYRQQALRWVVAACDRLGLRLGLYGNGWEKNPEFARFARGPVAYGGPLEELTRRSSINLQIVPFSCLHQRLLDGVAADGFFLIRGHPIDAIAAKLWRFLCNLPATINNLRDARRLLPPPERAAWDDLVTRLNVIVDGDDPDPIANFRGRQAEGHGYLYEAMPRLEEVTFHNEAGLERQIKAFMASPGERRSIVAEQRRFVEEHYAYEAGVRRVMRSISGLIAAEEKS